MKSTWKFGMVTLSVRVSAILILLIFISCGDNMTGIEIDVPPQDLLALTVQFKEEVPGEGTPGRLVLMDYNNPSDYFIITSSSFRIQQPKFSPDKKRIVFTNQFENRRHVGGRVYIFDVKEGRLHAMNISKDNPLHSHWIIWKSDGNGFYHSGQFSQLQYYDITINKNEIVKIQTFAYPVATGGPGTVLVFSGGPPTEEIPLGFYFVDHTGNFLERIDNPDLMRGTLEEHNVSETQVPDWHNESGLLVYEGVGGETNKHNIYITNIDGTITRDFVSTTAGRHPDWGPEGKSILYLQGIGGGRSKVVKLDVATGEVTDFITPDMIEGARSIEDVDY